MIPGDTLAAKYKIIEVLGQGGSGCVYLAENIKLCSLWAIKEIPAERREQIDCLIEPNILKKLEHQALPRVYDVLEEQGSIYFIMDYIEGISLDRRLAEIGSFPESTVLEWAEQLCRVLDYLHTFKPNPVIYRDMKPSNIILTKAGILKLVDFGTAREYKKYADTDTVFIGTRGYAAPEQYGRGQSDIKTDIYSLGVTLHHLLTGKGPNEAPYEIKPIRSYNPDFSEELEKIILKCTRQDPAERYDNIPELLADIKNISEKAAGGIWFEDSKIQGKLQASARNTFKRLVLTIWGNPEFGCELAYFAAKRSGYSVLLADLDLLAPKADLYLGIKKFPGMVLNEGILGNSGLNMAIEAADKNILKPNLIKEVSSRNKDIPGLFTLTGNYRLENYEYFSDSSLMKLIDMAYSSFDITILLASGWIYDSYTVVALSRSDFNIIPVHADIGAIREFNSYIAFLADKQKIPADRSKFIAYEYTKEYNLTQAELEKAVEGNYIGEVRYSKKRAACRNNKSVYAAHMEKEIQDDYTRILSWFGIIPEPGLRDILLKSINKLSTVLGNKKRPVKLKATGGE